MRQNKLVISHHQILVIKKILLYIKFKMTSFGQLRNSLGRLAELNRNMGILSHLKYSKNVLEQTQIKNQPILFYLQILHYIFTEYSPELYKAILEISPNIKTQHDSKFVETCFTIARRMFNLNLKITVEQFLQQGKLLQKRLECLVNLVQEVYKWQNKSKPKATKEIKNVQYSREAPISSRVQDDLDEQDLQVREIKIKPTQFKFQTEFIPKSKPAPVRQHEVQSPITVNKNVKANVFPKNIVQNNYISDQQQSQNQTKMMPQKTLQKVTKQLAKDKPMRQLQSHRNTNIQENDQNNYVTRDEYNELVGMLASMNETITNLVSKFNTFQTHVAGEVTKLTARISLVEQNVKIIKANI